MRRHSSSKLLTLGAMVTSLCVLCLFAAGMFTAARIPLLLFASVCAYALICEGAYLIAALSFLASSALSFFLIQEKAIVLIFALLPGHYGIMRGILHARIENRPLRLLLKLIYCNLCAALGVYLALEVFGITLPLVLPVWALMLILQSVFIVYDLFYGISAAIYENRLRRILMPRR